MEIVADFLTKKGSKGEVVDELMEGIISKHDLNKINLVKYINDEIFFNNLTTKDK